MNDLTPMPFGKHAGVALANVPASYLLWMWDQFRVTPPTDEVRIQLREYIKDNLEVLKMERDREHTLRNAPIRYEE